MKPAYKLLRSAREMIQKYGFIKGVTGDQKRGFCTYGAMSHDTDFNSLAEVRALNRATAVVATLINHWSITLWNDRAETTKEDVINLFTKAMRKCR